MPGKLVPSNRPDASVEQRAAWFLAKAERLEGQAATARARAAELIPDTKSRRATPKPEAHDAEEPES